tara:strand:- start:222 stop:1493 length:1272 start_codon:yes stop_codon:yes gene_type:complete
MEVKSGYKRIGSKLIPEDWDFVSLETVTTRIGDGLHGTPVYSSNGVYPFINGNNLADGNIVITSDTKMVDYSEFRKNFKPLSNNSILISINGTIGNLALYNEEQIILGKSAAYINVIPEILREFVYYCLQSNLVRKFFSNGLTGSTIGNLSLATIRRTFIPLPSLNEQKNIVTALRDTDKLLNTIDQLIFKKRNIKQGFIQEYLNGQSRLPGFCGDWEIKFLGEIGEISSAGVDKKIHLDEVPVRLVNYLDVYNRDFIYSKDLNHSVTATKQQVIRCNVKKGDIFFTPTSETRDDIACSAVSMEDIPDATYSYHVTRLRLHEEWDLLFSAYIFKTRDFLDQAEKLCDGNGTRYVISQSKFRSMTIKVPEISEQTAIGKILFDMDTELDLLEARKNKTLHLKQAIMEEILSGKTRLIKSEKMNA